MQTSTSYEEFVDKGVMLNPDTPRERLLLGALGLGGESGEVVDHIKKHVFHGKPLDVDALILELGDVMWYFTLLCNELDEDVDGVRNKNMKKLIKRYPERYDVNTH